MPPAPAPPPPGGPRARALLLAAAAACPRGAAASATFLAGLGWRTFDKAGIETAVGFVNLTMDPASMTNALTLGRTFTVQSSAFTCNVAQRLDAATGRLASYVVPEGEGDEISKLPYLTNVYAADASGRLLSSVAQSTPWDVTSVADAPGAGPDVSFGLGTRPPMDINLPVFVVVLNSSSGLVENVTDAIPGVLDAEECASAAGSSPGSGAGTLLFVNNRMHVNPFHRMMDVILFDVGTRTVANVLNYPYGILSAITGWRNRTSGEALALAFAWPAVGSDGPALVAFDPAAKSWDATVRVVWAFDKSVLPMPHCLAVDGDAGTDAVYGLLEGSDCPPNCFQDIQLASFFNVSSPAGFSMTKVFIGPPLEKTFSTGIGQCAVV